MLQEASTILEEQLIDFENAVDTLDEKNVNLTNEIETLQAKIQTLSAESLKAQKLMDMQKFSNLSAEIKNKEFLQRLEEEQLKSSELEVNIIFFIFIKLIRLLFYILIITETSQ